MKNISLKNYTTDKYYPKIVKAVDAEWLSRLAATVAKRPDLAGRLIRVDLDSRTAKPMTS